MSVLDSERNHDEGFQRSSQPQQGQIAKLEVCKMKHLLLLPGRLIASRAEMHHDAYLIHTARLALLLASFLYIGYVSICKPSTPSQSADSNAMLHEESLQLTFSRHLGNGSDDDSWFKPNRHLGCKSLQMPKVLCSVVIGAKQHAIDNLMANMKALGPQVSALYCTATLIYGITML
jgi:hypothetical protein